MAVRLSSRMKDLRRERDAEFAAAPNRQGIGTALVLVNDKLTRRNAEFGTPQYKSSRIAMRDRTAARKGSLAGDQVGFAKPLHGGVDRHESDAAVVMLIAVPRVCPSSR